MKKLKVTLVILGGTKIIAGENKKIMYVTDNMTIEKGEWQVVPERKRNRVAKAGVSSLSESSVD